MSKIDAKWLPTVMRNETTPQTSGSIFEIFGGFRTLYIFDDFVIGGMLVKLLKNRIWGAKVSFSANVCEGR